METRAAANSGTVIPNYHMNSKAPQCPVKLLQQSELPVLIYEPPTTTCCMFHSWQSM